MKVLLDENLPHDLRHLIVGHGVFTVAFMGWGGVENGGLLDLAGQHGFDVLISMDRGLEHQHDHTTLPVAVVLLRAPSNRLEDLAPLVPDLLAVLPHIRARTLTRIPHE